MKVPKVTFNFSCVVGAVYALEMMMEEHAVKIKVSSPVHVFDEGFMEKLRQELSLPSFFWHLRPSIAMGKGLSLGLKRYCRKMLLPILMEVERRYEPHWNKVLPMLKENVNFLVNLWGKHGGSILREIANISRHSWKVEEIKVFMLEPIVGGHGDAFPEGGVVTIEAIKMHSLRPMLGFTHEIAHVNTAIPLLKAYGGKDIRSKVLYEVVNEYVSQQALVNVGIIHTLDSESLERSFTEGIQGWMTESRTRFIYNPQELKQIVDQWWMLHLQSNENLLQSFKKLQRKALSTMKVKNSVNTSKHPL